MQQRESPVTGFILVVGPFLVLGSLFGLLLEGPAPAPSLGGPPPVVREAMEGDLHPAATAATESTTPRTTVEDPAARGDR